ncbi:hypothetical protein OG21DRAFT_1508189 [Imleria badia]|nr:hypothetical protein OG21DRAFT_1508189 [Imleria badia]
MHILLEFDTLNVHPWYMPQLDTQATLNFPRPFDAPPRLPHGFCSLDMNRNSNIRVRSTLEGITESRADFHIMTWSNSIIHWAVAHVFALAPGEVEFLSGEHSHTPRDDPASVRIDFERPFSDPPKVVVFFNLVDLEKDHGWRLKTTATDIDAKGFTLNIETWGDTILHAMQVCWIAYPEDREHIFSASINTMGGRPENPPEFRHSSGTIAFDPAGFWKKPAVFVALNSFDISCKSNLRIRTYVDGVSRTGLVWHIESYSDSNLHSASVSIIAFL